MGSLFLDGTVGCKVPGISSPTWGNLGELTGSVQVEVVSPSVGQAE